MVTGNLRLTNYTTRFYRAVIIIFLVSWARGTRGARDSREWSLFPGVCLKSGTERNAERNGYRRFRNLAK